jgi:outer membrane protein
MKGTAVPPALAALTLILLALPVSAQTRKLTAAEAVELARGNADALTAARLQSEAARIAVDEARSRMLPRLSTQVSGSYLVNPPAGVTVKAGALGSLPAALGGTAMPARDIVIVKDAERGYYKLGATLTQPIFTWGRIRAAIDLAKGEARLAATGFSGKERDVVRETKRAYFGALLAERSAAILTGLRDTAASIVEDRQRSLEEGQATREDVLGAEADLAGIEARLVEAGESGASAREALGMLTGIDAKAVTLASDFRDDAGIVDEEKTRKAALAGSTDLDTALSKRDEAQAKLALERAGATLLPNLALSVAADAAGQRFPGSSDWTGTWNWDVTISLGATIELFDAGEAAARIGEARKDLDAASSAVSMYGKLAGLDSRKAVQAVRNAAASVRERGARATLAAEKLRNARISADQGMIDRADLYGAEILDGTARLELEGAYYDLESALADIERLTGEDIDEHH